MKFHKIIYDHSIFNTGSVQKNVYFYLSIRESSCMEAKMGNSYFDLVKLGWPTNNFTAVGYSFSFVCVWQNECAHQNM